MSWRPASTKVCRSALRERKQARQSTDKFRYPALQRGPGSREAGVCYASPRNTARALR